MRGDARREDCQTERLREKLFLLYDLCSCASRLLLLLPEGSLAKGGDVVPRIAKSRPRPPFPFVLDALLPLNPQVRRMFSGFAVYSGDLLILMLRDHAEKSVEDNGVWLVLSETGDPADKKLRQEFPSLRRIALLGDRISHWLVIPADGPDFEGEALRACDLLVRRDPRLGRVPQSRR